MINNTVNSLTVTGAISGTGGLNKVGAGTLIVAAPDTHNGATTVAGGTLTVDGVGQIQNTTAINVKIGSTLTLDNNAATYNISGRLGTAPITLNGATFNFIGNNTAGVLSAESVGQVTLNSGQSLITSQSGSARERPPCSPAPA